MGNEEVNSLVEVKVDYEKCTGDSICIDVCPVAVFELQELQEYPGEKKSVVVDNDACIVCRACEVQGPTQAIVVTE
jgi:NAD-dependent dihydropyrimidine dehydrogenase PreA subunit